jgi:purine nucleosidase
VIAAHFGSETSMSMDKSYDETVRILGLAGMSPYVPVVRGAATSMPNEQTAVSSEGANLIIREALSDDPHPLFVICFGPLTDVASAYLSEPAIADRLTTTWSGGGPYPGGGYEFNLHNDIHAANVVMQSRMPFWQFPQDVYSMVRVTTAELALKLRNCGEIGDCLLQNNMRFNDERRATKGWPRGEDWTLGDSPAISVLMNQHQHTDHYQLINAPLIDSDHRYIPQSGGRQIRVYDRIDGRVILEDFFAKLQLVYGVDG